MIQRACSQIQQITDNEEANLELEQQVLQFYDFIYYKCFSKVTLSFIITYIHI